MKTHHFRSAILDDPTHGVIEWCDIHARVRQFTLNPKLAIIGRQPMTPSLFAGSIGFCLDMTKEVNVDWLVSQRSQRLDRLGCELGLHRSASDRT
jgi:hypothetical protein